MLYRLIASVLVAMSLAVTGPARASLVWDFAFESPDLTANGTVVFTGPDSIAGDQIESFQFEGTFLGAPVMFATPDIIRALWLATPELVFEYLLIEAVQGPGDLWGPALSLQIIGPDVYEQFSAIALCGGLGCAPFGIAGVSFDPSPVHGEAVPEPSALWIFSLGLVGVLLMALRTRRAAGGGAPLVHGVSVGARPSSSPTAA